MKALKERLKKPGEDVADQWADRNSSETAGLVENEQVQESTTATAAAVTVLSSKSPAASEESEA